MYMKKKKNKFKFPNFDKMTYEEEAKWWDSHDLGDYWDEMEDVKIVWALNKPREETLSVRLPGGSKEKLAAIAKNKGVNVSTLARIALTRLIQSTQ